MLDFLRNEDGRIDSTKMMIIIAFIFGLIAVGAFSVAFLMGPSASEKAAQEEQQRLETLRSLGGGDAQPSAQDVAVPPQAQSADMRGVRYDAPTAPAAPSTSPSLGGQPSRSAPSAPAVDEATQRRLQMLNSLGAQK